MNTELRDSKSIMIFHEKSSIPHHVIFWWVRYNNTKNLSESLLSEGYAEHPSLEDFYNALAVVEPDWLHVYTVTETLGAFLSSALWWTHLWSNVSDELLDSLKWDESVPIEHEACMCFQWMSLKTACCEVSISMTALKSSAGKRSCDKPFLRNFSSSP